MIEIMIEKKRKNYDFSYASLSVIYYRQALARGKTKEKPEFRD